MVDRRRMRKVPKLPSAIVSGFAAGPLVVAAVDSAKLKPAWCVGSCGQIQAVGFDSSPGTARSPVPWEPAVCVVELSRSYGSKDTGKHGDIIAETAGGCLTAGSMRAGKVVFVAPDEWAGQSQKAPRHSLLWEVLLPSERLLIANAGGFESPAALERYIFAACEAVANGKDPKYSGAVHNLLDAAGLYLFAVGRIGKAGLDLSSPRGRARKAPRPVYART